MKWAKERQMEFNLKENVKCCIMVNSNQGRPCTVNIRPWSVLWNRESVVEQGGLGHNYTVHWKWKLGPTRW